MMVSGADVRPTLKDIVLGDNRRQQELHQHANKAMAFPRCVDPEEVTAFDGQGVRRRKIWGQVVSGVDKNQGMTCIVRA